MPTTTKGDRKGLPIQNFPAHLKRRLIQKAERDESNLNDVAVGILAAALDVRYTPNGRRSAGIGDSDYLGLAMPHAVWKKITVTAAQRETSARELTIALIADHFHVRP